MQGAVRMASDGERQLGQVDWADVGIRLTAYATWKARNLRWRTGLRDALAGGRTPEDLAAEAILKVLAGERGWDPQRGALLPYLEGVVDSLISHLAESADNRVQERWSDAYDRAAEGAPASDPAERIERLRAILLREQQHGLLALVDAVEAGCEATPQALARQLAISIADVNNRLKRLRRLAQRVVQDLPARTGARTP